MSVIRGIHAVREALAAGRAVERILIARGRHGERIEEIVQLARSAGVPVRFEERSQLDRLAPVGEHQGVVALGASKRAVRLEDLLLPADGPQKGLPNGLIVLLDGVEDPNNLGAIIRSALAAGADGVVLPDRRAAGLTDAVERASAGALAHIRVARVNNINRAMEELKEAGYWLVGLDERGEKNYTEADYTGHTGVVLGGEGKGLHDLVRKNCDFVVSIPTVGPVRSLNVSVAAGVVLFEAVRQRTKRL